MRRRATAVPVFILLSAMCVSCSPERSQPTVEADIPRPSILLVTLDTTRADSVGFESDAVETPALDALAARGMRFSQAWTTVPMTLPAHTSMMTGLYPSEHGIRENSRFLDDDRTLLAERLRDAGYATAAFVSGYPLKRRFGLARGFDHYDDDMGKGNAERAAGPTTDRALSYLESTSRRPIFIWVHYFDPHDPYAPPEPFRSRYASSPYLGEIAYMDQELERLIEAFEGRNEGGDSRILVVGDHGEGLGDHGELLHGNLLYRGVMRVPLILAGSGVPIAAVETAVSTRRVFDTILGWAGLESDFDLLSADEEIVMGEALKPYLQYGWQPQVMAVRGTVKVIQSGETEVYDLRSDPSESEDLSDRVEIDPEILEAIRSYALVPAIDGETSSGSLDEETMKQLAVLGYVGWESPAPVREDAPNPRDMTHLFGDLNEGAELFVREEYEASIRVFDRVLAEDDENLMVTVRLAVAYSVLGNEERAQQLFSRAEQIHPGSIDLQHYLAMHYFRFHRWDLAAPLFEKVLTLMPRKLPALEALARIRESEGRFDDAALLVESIVVLKESPAADWIRLGELEMAMTDTPAAIRAFEEARRLQGEAFDRYLELGVCYLAEHSFAAAAEALDLVPQSHPGYAMALFKRAQASVLLGEPDWRDRVRFAYERADPDIRRLIETEPLFQGMAVR
jgi:arylsulfatase A-like enzyme/Tfp pilus assembly protein PilF